VREHTAAIRPPRALWVPFILGRPFGAPGDPAFQRRVLMAALRLLESPEPVLADYPEEAPAAAADELNGIACPVSFDRTAEAADWGALLEREIEELAPWHDLAVSRRSRTTTGFSGVTIAEAARVVASSLRSAPMPNLAGMNAGETLKVVCDEIRAYYYEAAGAQPGHLDGNAIQRWFWQDTAAGRAFLSLQKICVASEDPSLQVFGGNTLVPRDVRHMLAI
jgi:hypothetical protein